MNNNNKAETKEVSEDDNLKDSPENDIQERVNIMESESYEFNPFINLKDVIGMVIVGIICAFGLIWGVI